MRRMLEQTSRASGLSYEPPGEGEVLPGFPLHLAGDCLAPRSAEEAVYEGMTAGLAV